MFYYIYFSRKEKKNEREQTCPLEPYALYNKPPFSSFPPHLRIADARKVALTALCAM